MDIIDEPLFKFKEVDLPPSFRYWVPGGDSIPGLPHQWFRDSTFDIYCLILSSIWDLREARAPPPRVPKPPLMSFYDFFF